MNLEAIIHIAPSYILLSALIPLIYFEYRYARFSPWRLTPLGRNVMYQKVVMTALLLFIILSLFSPHFAFRDEIRLVLYSSLVYMFWRDVFQLVKDQRANRERRTGSKTKTRR